MHIRCRVTQTRTRQRVHTHADAWLTGSSGCKNAGLRHIIVCHPFA
jgi:hypothetical protein